MPHGHWKTTTFVAALRSDGLTAPVVIDGAMTGEIFLSYVRNQLVPTLQPGTIVVMDNLAAHQVARVREAIESAAVKVASLATLQSRLQPNRAAVLETQKFASS